MNLYFVDADDKQHLVAEDVAEENVAEYISQDIEERKPGFVIYCMRHWWDNFLRHWTDFGSHTEFYILQDPKKALNVVKDKNKKSHTCSEDYCEI